MWTKGLRIGNYVRDRYGKLMQIDYFEYTIVGQKAFVIEGMEAHPLTERISMLKPIPLREKWLLDFGFTEDANGRVLTKELNSIDKVLVMNQGNGFYYPEINQNHECVNELHIVSLNRIQCVHELQNLYIVLTGEELTLNVKPETLNGV